MTKKKKERPPAFPFYAGDWLASEKVMLMDLDEKGGYIDLLAHNWLRGSIPADRASIAALLKKRDGSNGTPDGDLMARLMAMVSKCFVPMKRDPSRLINPRLEKERLKKKEYHDGQRERGKRGAKAKWGNRVTSSSAAYGTAINLPMAKNGSSSSSSSSSSLPPNPQGGNEGEDWIGHTDPKLRDVFSKPITRPT